MAEPSQLHRGQENESEASFLAATRLPLRRVVMFGTGSLGAAAFIVAPQLLLLFYMTDRLGIPPAFAGTALLVPKFWELAVDPAIGAWSDRSRGHRGRLPFLLAGALILPAGFAALFAVPDFASWPARLAWVSLAFLVATTGYSLFAVPYVALVGELAPSPAERTRLIAWRMGFVAIGILAAGALGPWLVAEAGGGRAAYALTGAAGAGLIALCLLCAVVAVGTTSRPTRGAAPAALRAIPAAVWRARELRALLLAYVVQMASNGLNAAMLAYAVHYLLRRGEEATGLIFAVFTLASLAATPAAGWLGKNAGKRAAFVLSSVLYAGGLALFWAAALPSMGAIWAAALLSGIGNAGTQVFAFSLLADVLERERDRSGQDSSATFTGVWIAAEKLGLALGAAIGGAGLALAGFDADAAAGQSPVAREAIALLLSIIPALLMLASLALLGPVERLPPAENGK